MTAQALILQAPRLGDEIKRWALAGAIVTAAHFGLVASYLLMPEPQIEGAPLSPAVMVELAPVPVAPASPNDIAPGLEMPEEQPSPKPPPQVEPEVVEPMPKFEAPAEVTLPEPKPKAAEKKPEESPDTQQSATTPAQQSAVTATSAPRSEQHTASTPQAPSPGSAQSRDAIVSWRSLVSSKIKSAQRYPIGARARNEQGTVTIRFTLSRDGNVLSRSIVRGSGHPELDQEALAMIARAAPFPAFPPSMTGASITFPVPINFGLQ